MAVLSDEQAMLRDLAQDWAQNEAPLSAFRAFRNAAPVEGFDVAKWQAQSEMGLPGIIVPEAYGGSGMGYLSLGIVMEQLGRTLVATPLAAGAAAASAIILGGSEAQKATWLPRIASGAVIATLAVDEGPHFAPDKIAASVSGGLLTGTKAFVDEGDGAQLFVVAASDGLYLVERGEGVTVATRHMVDSRSHAEVRFDGAAAEKLADGPADLLTQLCDRAAAAAAAEMLGMATAAFETTNAYLKQRVQFGQLLSSFQALQHRMAQQFTELELMRSAVEGALEAIDSGRSDVRDAVSLAKALAGDTLNLVSRETIQLHGGIGMTDEYDVGFFLKRARVLETKWGNAAWHRERFAALSGY